jgi:hypothetical protein
MLSSLSRTSALPRASAMAWFWAAARSHDLVLNVGRTRRVRRDSSRKYVDVPSLDPLSTILTSYSVPGVCAKTLSRHSLTEGNAFAVTTTMVAWQ